MSVAQKKLQTLEALIATRDAVSTGGKRTTNPRLREALQDTNARVALGVGNTDVHALLDITEDLRRLVLSSGTRVLVVTDRIVDVVTELVAKLSPLGPLVKWDANTLSIPVHGSVLKIVMPEDYKRALSSWDLVVLDHVAGGVSKVLERIAGKVITLLSLRDLEDLRKTDTVGLWSRHQVSDDEVVERYRGPLIWFCRTRLKVRDIGGTIVPFDPLRSQRLYRHAKRMGHKKGYNLFAVLKSRKQGVTTWEEAQSYRLCVERPESSCITLAHTDADTQTIFRIAKRFHENDKEAPPLIGNNGYSLHFNNNSLFRIATARGVAPGRGDTVNRVHASEVAFYQPSTVESLMAGLINMMPTGVGELVCETTPNGYEWFQSTYAGAKGGTNAYWPIFLPWFTDTKNVLPVNDEAVRAMKDTLSDEEEEVMQRYQLTWGQLAWRRLAKRKSRLFVQEFPEDDESCFLSTGTTFFDMAIVGLLLRRLEKEGASSVGKAVTISRTFSGRMWFPPIPGRKYVIGVDTSSGVPPVGTVRTEPCGLGVVDHATGQQVYDEHGYARPALLADRVAEVHAMYNKALVVPERNNHGGTVIERLISHHRLRPGRDIFIDHDDEPGFGTDVVSRPALLDLIYEVMASPAASEIVRDPRFLAECKTFKLQASGRWEHDANAYDDSLFKWGLAWWGRVHGRTAGGILTRDPSTAGGVDRMAGAKGIVASLTGGL